MARLLLVGALVVGVGACSPSSRSAPMAPSTTVAAVPGSAPPTGRSPAGSFTVNGAGSQMPAYYDGQIFTINFTELPPGGETANLTHNGSINNIYQSDQCNAAGKPFVSVIDAIPTDGMNPLWQEVQITFTSTSACVQFKSDDAVLAAAKAGTITLQPTGELYRCSVVGKP